MHEFFIFTADFSAWQQHRLFSACRTFASALDPAFAAEALYLEKTRVGWTFWLSTDEDRRRLAAFFSGLTGKVAAERPYGDPVIQGR